MANRKETIYWDTCIFIAWFQCEIYRPNGEFAGVLECVEKVNKNQILLVTSATMAKKEIHATKMDNSAKQKFESLFKRRNAQFLEPNPKIYRLTDEIVNYYDKQSELDGYGSVSKADAEHLATAIIYNVDAFYTYDEGVKSNDRGLLNLNGDVAGHQLRICKPQFKQFRLLFPE